MTDGQRVTFSLKPPRRFSETSFSSHLCVERLKLPGSPVCVVGTGKLQGALSQFLMADGIMQQGERDLRQRPVIPYRHSGGGKGTEIIDMPHRGSCGRHPAGRRLQNHHLACLMPGAMQQQIALLEIAANDGIDLEAMEG